MEHNTGRVQFEAAPFTAVTQEMEKLWSDIDELVKTNLTIEEVFYYAAFIHLAFVCIHPFNDGNGRTGRLLEKWFIAQKAGSRAWYMQAERYYYEHHSVYYANIRKLGLEYDTLDYEQALPFLLMLPGCLAV